MEGRRIHHLQTYLSSFKRQSTRIGKIPDDIKSSIGGFLSLESNFLQDKNNLDIKF